MPGFDDLYDDLAYAVRTLRRDPGLVAGIVLTFALAIGTNAAMFGLVGQLLRTAPPGVHDAERVTRVQLQFPGDGGERYSVSTTSYPAFRALSEVDRAFSAVAAVTTDTLAIGRGAEAEQVTAVEASGGYFAVLDVRPQLGRFFSPSEDILPAGSPVAVLSHAYWKRHFAGDRGVVGKEIVLDDRPFTIIGVAPKGFTGDKLTPVDLFVPLTAAFRTRDPKWISEPHMNLVEIIARLRPGVTPAAVAPLATAAARSVLTENAGDPPIVDLTALLPGRSGGASPQTRTALWLTGVALIVLLIATANVGTLLLLRALRRRREIAVRIALGVRRGRLVRQLLTESLLLSFVGGAAGLVAAGWLAGVIRATLLPGLAGDDGFVDGNVLAATLAAACLAGIIAGCAPLVQLRGRDIVGELRESAGTATAARSALRSTLVGVQVALSTLLLVGAGLFVRSLQRLQAQDLGFSTEHLLVVTLDVHASLPGPDRDLLHVEAARRLTALPGITSATIMEATPFGAHHVPPISVPGRDGPPSVGGQLPFLYAATPEYLRMMRVIAREGRLFTARDGRGSPLVVLVNETMARAVWPGESAIGKCVRFGFDATLPLAPSPVASPTLPCREVVGVVRDSRARSLLPDRNEARLMQYYVPFAQMGGVTPFPNEPQVSAILVQTSATPASMIAPVQRLVQENNAVSVLARARPYQELIDPQLRSWRLGATLFSVFGGLALGIAAVGLFGVISYHVAQRTREVGVRMALGASGVHVGWLVVSDALRMVGAGITAGVLTALAAAPLIQSMLFQTSAREMSVLIVAAAVLIGATLLAALVPAWRATRVSPLVALRTD